MDRCLVASRSRDGLVIELDHQATLHEWLIDLDVRLLELLGIVQGAVVVPEMGRRLLVGESGELPRLVFGALRHGASPAPLALDAMSFRIGELASRGQREDYMRIVPCEVRSRRRGASTSRRVSPTAVTPATGRQRRVHTDGCSDAWGRSEQHLPLDRAGSAWGQDCCLLHSHEGCESGSTSIRLWVSRTSTATK